MTEKENISDAENRISQKNRRWLFWATTLWVILILVPMSVYIGAHFSEFIKQIFIAMSMVLVIFLIGLAIERIKPAERQEPVHTLPLNIISALVIQFFLTLQTPLVTLGLTFVLNRVGFGFMALSAHSWYIIPSSLLFIFVKDFTDYSLHRAFHIYPVLWAMHSFHHSDRSINITTTWRHFWLGECIFQIASSLPVAILFKVPPEILSLYGILLMIDYLEHLNVRLSLGPFSKLVNGPQYHRIHHSRLPKHWNKNFSTHFPIFDIIFGTHYHPQPAEFPPTGLGEEKHMTFADIALWPFRPSERLSQEELNKVIS